MLQMIPYLTTDTEKCTICGQDVDYIQHMRVQHQVDEDVGCTKSFAKKDSAIRRESRHLTCARARLDEITYDAVYKLDELD